MIKRRTWLFLLGAAALTAHVPLGFAQQKSVPRIGVLEVGDARESAPRMQAFAQGLAELGYVEGKSIVIERRFAAGNEQRLSTLAAELITKGLDVFVAPTSLAVQAAKPIAGATPIVFVTAGSPVENGFVASLSKPGGNITGLSNVNPDLGPRRLQMLKEAFPKSHAWRCSIRPERAFSLWRCSAPQRRWASKCCR